jgi:hypothetical protein
MAESAVRFAVGAPAGPRSGVWKLWTRDGSSDVYLASRHLGGTSKVSFHQSGRWRNALVSTPARVTDAVVVDLADAEDPRMAHVWDRTDNAGPGWTYAFAVIVPEPDVFGPSRPGNLGSRVVHRQPPEPGTIAVVAIYWASPAAPMRDYPPRVNESSWPIGRLDLATRDRVWVVTFDLPLREVAAKLAQMKRDVLDAIARSGVVDLTNRRASLHGVEGEGHRYTYDLALEVPPEAYVR